MHTYERSIRVGAPFEEVWAFHSSESGLEALTPSWMGLHIESVQGPDGEADPPELVVGSLLTVTTRPFGIGPEQRWTSEIVARERRGGAGYFRDVMHEGPFRTWEHTHLFYADGDSTILRDHVRYELPLGPLSGAFDPLAYVGFEPLFRYRHRRTRALLERST